MPTAPDEPMDEGALACAEDACYDLAHDEPTMADFASGAVQAYLNECARLGFTMQPTPDDDDETGTP